VISKEEVRLMQRICTEPSLLPTVEDMQKFAEDPRYFHFVGLLYPPQPGVRILFARLEHDSFPPGTPRYELLKATIILWSRKEWAMISTPKQEAGLVQKIAAKCGLLVAQGQPVMNYPEGPEEFPICGNGSNIFTLLNPPNHILFSGNIEEVRDVISRETLQVLALNQRWEARN
jgi:hypothetical protein